MRSSSVIPCVAEAIKIVLSEHIPNRKKTEGTEKVAEQGTSSHTSKGSGGHLASEK